MKTVQVLWQPYNNTLLNGAHTTWWKTRTFQQFKKKTSFIHENSSRYILYLLNTLLSRVVSDLRYNAVHALEPKNLDVALLS